MCYKYIFLFSVLILLNYNFFFQPHGPVNTKPTMSSAVSRGRGGRTSTAHDHDESSTTPSMNNCSSSGVGASHPLPQSHEDDEMPLARVRDTAIALKACVSHFALLTLSCAGFSIKHFNLFPLQAVRISFHFNMVS